MLPQDDLGDDDRNSVELQGTVRVEQNLDGTASFNRVHKNCIVSFDSTGDILTISFNLRRDFRKSEMRDLLQEILVIDSQASSC